MNKNNPAIRSLILAFAVSGLFLKSIDMVYAAVLTPPLTSPLTPISASCKTTIVYSDSCTKGYRAASFSCDKNGQTIYTGSINNNTCTSKGLLNKTATNICKKICDK